MDFKKYAQSSILLVRTIGKIRTNFDVMRVIAEGPSEQNQFWDIVFSSLYSSIVIDSFKLIDRKNLSIFSLIKEAKTEKLDKIDELDNDYTELLDWISNNDFTLVRFRHTREAHISRKLPFDSKIPVYANLDEIFVLLNKCETLIKKYNLWIQGPTYNIKFNSIYAGGHKEILDYVYRTLK